MQTLKNCRLSELHVTHGYTVKCASIRRFVGVSDTHTSLARKGIKTKV